MANKTGSAISSTMSGGMAGAQTGNPYAAAAGAGVGLLTSLLGGGDESAGRANDARNIAVQIMNDLEKAPDISKPLILERYRQAGVLTPEMEQYIAVEQPKAITTDPRFKTAQMQALQQMQERATGGMTAADRAALHQVQSGVQGDINSRLASIQQQAAMRGQAGGGSELTAKLIAAQTGANREAESADRLAQQQQAGRENALAQMAQYAAQGQQQDFGQQFQQQQAQNELNRFNVGNQISQQQRNVGASNQAQAGNLGNLQNIYNANTQQGNQEQQNQLNRQMQEYQANTNRAILQSNARAGQANQLMQAGEAETQGKQNQGAGMGQMAQSLYGAFSSGGSSGPKDVGYGPGVTKAMHEGTDPDMWGGRSEGGQIDYRDGGHVYGKEVVPGDHPANDTVKARLSPGEIVIPKSLADSKLGKELLKLIHAHNSVKNKLNQED